MAKINARIAYVRYNPHSGIISFYNKNKRVIKIIG